MAGYRPPFRMTNAIIDGLTKISEQLGRMMVLGMDNIPDSLYEECHIHNIHSTLFMDGKTLEQVKVREILDVKDATDESVREVQNIYRLYQSITEINPFSMEDLLMSHAVLMDGISKENGKFRTGEVRVYEGNRVLHVASPFRFVSKQVSELLEWYKDSQMHPLIKSAVFRFEFECIHPFSEGNARLGRLWHRILMGQWKNLFYYLPIEDWIIGDQDKYFAALAKAYKEGDGNAFVEMFLNFILRSLEELEDFKKNYLRTSNDQEKVQEAQADYANNTNISKLLEIVKDKEVSALEMMHCLGLKHRPTFRNNYLNPALESGALVRTVPDKPNSKNQKYKKNQSKF